MKKNLGSYWVPFFLCALIFLGSASQAWSFSPISDRAGNISKTAADSGANGHPQANADDFDDQSLIAIEPFISTGTAYYVDKDADGLNNGTSWLDAWESFAEIDWAVIGPGDTVFISGGSSSKTYHEILDVRASGAQGNPIVIARGDTPAHEGEVILDGQMNLAYGVRVENQEYVVISGLRVGNFAESGQVRVRYSTGVVVEDNDIYVTGHGGVYLHSNTGAIVRGNRITTPSYIEAQTDGIYSQLNVGNIYENNLIVISNAETTGHDDAIQMYRDTDIIVRGNVIEQDNDKVSNAQGIYATNSYGTIEVYNNVVYGPNTKNCLLTLAIYDEGNAQLIAYHNTLVGGGWGVLYVKDAPNSIVKNNILMTDKEDGWLLRLDGPLADVSNIDYNLYYAPSSGIVSTINGAGKTWAEWRAYGHEARGLNVDPLLVDVNDRDFHLQGDSPAIDAGVSLPSVSADLEGKRRPQGHGHDIGAYEYLNPEILGDLNLDGIVDETDVRLCVRVVLGLEGDAAIISRADLNADGKVDAIDVQRVIHLIGGS